MIISAGAQSKEIPAIRLSNESIELVSEIKYLSILIARKLKFTTHFENGCGSSGRE